MSAYLEQTIIVENKPGAGGTIASREIAAAKPDGLTIGWGSAGTSLLNTLVLKNPGFDPLTDFAPIGMVAELPFALFINARQPINSLEELVAYARAKPGELNYGSDGLGTTTHLAAELFKTVANVDIVHIPYKGAISYEPDLTTGRLQLGMAGVGYAPKWVGSGSIRALAVTSAKRIPALPDIPTVAEAGYPDFVLGSWFALLAPKQTPPQLVARYHEALQKALKTDAIKNFVSMGYILLEGPSEMVTARVEKELPMWKSLVEKASLTPTE